MLRGTYQCRLSTMCYIICGFLHAPTFSNEGILIAILHPRLDFNLQLLLLVLIPVVCCCCWGEGKEREKWGPGYRRPAGIGWPVPNTQEHLLSHDKDRYRTPHQLLNRYNTRKLSYGCLVLKSTYRTLGQSSHTSCWTIYKYKDKHNTIYI